MVSMLLTIVGLFLLLVLSDAHAASSGYPVAPADSSIANPKDTEDGAEDDAGTTEMDWRETSHLQAEVVPSQKSGSDVDGVRHIGNTDGILTDSD
jgi:hypothetical protein